MGPELRFCADYGESLAPDSPHLGLGHEKTAIAGPAKEATRPATTTRPTKKGLAKLYHERLCTPASHTTLSEERDRTC